MGVAYHETAIVEACCVSQGPEIAGRSQSRWCICLTKKSFLNFIVVQLQLLRERKLNQKRQKIHLHIHELNCATITGREHSENFKAPTVTEPRWPIFEDLCYLQENNKLKLVDTIKHYDSALKRVTLSLPS